MSPSLNHFGAAVEGKIPNKGQISDACVMGKKTAAIDTLAQEIGHGVAVGRVDLSGVAFKTNAAHVEIVTPPAFMMKDEGKTYTKNYVYSAEKNEDIGSARVSDPKMVL